MISMVNISKTYPNRLLKCGPDLIKSFLIDITQNKDKNTNGSKE